MKTHQVIRLIAVAVCSVMIFVLSPEALAKAKTHKSHRTPASKHAVKKSKKTAHKNKKKKSHKTALKKKHLKKTKIAKHSAYPQRKFVPPARVRIIDTAGKPSPDDTTLPDMKDIRDVAISSESSSSPMTNPAPAPEADAFHDFETQ